MTLTLTDELDISRGDLIVSRESPAVTTKHFTASLVWMDEKPLDLTRRYLLKHTSRTVQAQVFAIQYSLNVETLERVAAETLNFNDIGLVEIESMQPLTADSYSTNRITGSFVLIDAVTNLTAAAGMIRETNVETETSITNMVTAADRVARWGHYGAHIHLTGPVVFADAAERALFLRGAFVVRPERPSQETIEGLTAAGALAVTHKISDNQTVTFGNEHAAVISVDDLLHFLKTYSILTGRTKG